MTGFRNVRLTSRFRRHRRKSAGWALVLAFLAATGLNQVEAQEVGFAGDDARRYGAMYRTYERLYGESLDAFGAEVRQLQTQGKRDAELQAAYARFRERNIALDRRYRQPVIQKMFDVANLRTSEFVTRTATSSQEAGQGRRAGPSDPITPSKGTRLGDPNYRPWGADTDAQGGSRVVDQLPDVAREMGLTTQDADRLFAREPGYTTTDNDVLEATIHKSGRLDRVGSASWQAQIEVDATKPETALHVDMKPGPMQDYVAVRDHESKARKGLDVPARNLLPGPEDGISLDAAVKLQGLAKGTLNSIGTAQLPDETLNRLMREHGIEGNSAVKLRNVLQSLKSGTAILPESVGLNEGNIERFQSLCRSLIDESARVTGERADTALQDNLARRDVLEASADSADREQGRQLRREIVDARKRMDESDRGRTRRAIESLTATVEAPTARTPDAPVVDTSESTRRRELMEQVERETTTRRNRQAIRDLYADVERRKAVDGETVVRDLENPRPTGTGVRGHSPQGVPPESSPAERNSLLVHPVITRGLAIGGALVATSQAFKEEYYEAEKRLIERRRGTPDADRPPTRREVLREVSIGRTSVRTLLNLTGVEGAWMAGQTMKYEWVQRTNDFIDTEVERRARIQRALGQPEDDLSFAAAAEIALKGSLRQVTRSAYEGAKGLPLVGDLVAAPENLFLVLESSFGVLHDQRTLDRILATSTGDQARDAAELAEHADQLLDQMRGIAAAAQRQQETLESLRALSQRADEQVEQLRDLFRADVQSLELARGQLGGTESVAARLPGAADIRRWIQAIQEATREAREIAATCQRLEAALNRGQIDCSTIRLQDPRLQDGWRTLLARQQAWNESSMSLESLLQSLGPALEVRQLELRLTSTRTDAGRTSEALANAGRLITSLVESRATSREKLRVLRDRIRGLHDTYAPRATPQVRGEWDRIVQQASALEIDLPAGDLAAAQALSRAAEHADLLARTETPQLPEPLQPRRIDGQLSGDLETVRQPLLDFGVTLERTREALDGLHQLCPVRSQFTVAADLSKTLTRQFRVSGEFPAGKLVYVWSFGDDSETVKTSQPTQSHTYAGPGEFRVVVRIFEELPEFSVERGEASVVVMVAGPAPPERPRRPPGQLALSVVPEVVLAGQLAQSVIDEKGFDPLLGKFPLGTYYGFHSLRIFHEPGTDAVDADLQLEISMKVHPHLFLGRYQLRMTAQAHGQRDPATGGFRMRVENARWTETLPDTYPPLGLIGLKGGPVTPEDRAAMEAVVRRVLGGLPGELNWSGEVSGSLDWNGFGGGQGRLEINPVFRGTWRVPEKQPYWIEWPEGVERSGNGPAWLRIYPNEARAREQFQWRSRLGPMSGPRRVLNDIGDEAVLVPGRGAIVRWGRWDMHLTGAVPNDPEPIRESLERVQEFLGQRAVESQFTP